MTQDEINEAITDEIMELRQDINNLTAYMMKHNLLQIKGGDLNALEAIQECREVIQSIT